VNIIDTGTFINTKKNAIYKKNTVFFKTTAMSTHCAAATSVGMPKKKL